MAAAVKFGKHLKELRLHLCQTSAASKGVREFIETQYVALKKSNPKFPILVRECSGVEPKLYARYDVFVYYPCRCPRNRSPSKIPPLCLPLGRLKGYMNSDASTVVKDKEYGKENVLQLSGKSSAQVLDSIKLLNDAKL